MSYIVVTSERARTDIDDATSWWARRHSVEQAERWFQGIRAAIHGLSQSPERYPVVEAKSIAYELRQLLFGLGSRPSHRVIFTVIGKTVLVLAVRHAARGPLMPDDLT